MSHPEVVVAAEHHLCRRRLVTVVALMVAMLTAGRHAPAAADDILGLMTQPGHITFMRHAWAPFDGAPRERVSAETLGPCETQRNLDDKGRADARALGEKLRAAGITFDLVYTSKWCRCRETAELIMGRPVENLALINSYFTDPDKSTRGPVQQAALKRYLNETLPPTARALMVTHGSLIQDLTGIFTDETEVVIVKADGRGGVTVVGRGLP